MSKKDYREKIEEHRQSINIEKTNSRQSRSRTTKNNKPKRRDPLMTILTVIFIFIPLVILVYVWGFYTPAAPSQAKDNEESEYAYEKNDNVKDEEANIKEPDLIDDTEDKDDQSEDVDRNTKQDDQKNEEPKTSEKPVTEKGNKEKPETNEKPSSDKDKNGQVQEEKDSKNDKPLKKNQYKIKSGDTLYRLADDNNTTVDAIMKANGLQSEDIQVGQIITIP